MKKVSLVLLLVLFALAIGLSACDDSNTKTEADVLADATSEDATNAETTVADTNATDTNGTEVSDTGADTVEDTTVADTQVDTLADTLSETETTTACTVGSCGTGEACNAVTGECVANNRCINAGDACDPNVAHPAAFACLDEGAGDICVATCGLSTDCSTNEYCRPVPGSPRGLCTASNCTGFWDTSCGAGSKCLTEVAGDPLATGVWGCFANVVPSLGEGDACSFTPECGAGMICSEQGICLTYGCAPTSNSVSCAAGSVCVTNEIGALVDVGICQLYDCDPFAAVSDCAVGQQCNPTIFDPVANAVGGMCDSQGTGALGSACTANNECGPQLLCIDSSCQAIPLCDLSATSGPGACASGELCAPFAFEGLGMCVPADCRFFDNNPCTGQDQCILEYLVTDASGAPMGSCQPSTGNLANGATCALSTDCGDQMICIDQICQTLCEPGSSTNTCGTGWSCGEVWGADAPVGVCTVDECDPFGTGGCASGEMCELVDLTVDPVTAATRLYGACKAIGAGAVGDACSGWASGECATGLFCLGDGAGGNSCWDMCNLDDGSGCATGQRCLSIGTDSNVGYCADNCTPFTGNECGAGEQCFPDFYDRSAGICLATGAGAEGTTCTDTTQCADGLVCAGTCQVMCDYTATTEAAGACGAGFECVAYAVDNEPITFGGCNPSCSAGGTNECATGQFCAGAALGATGTTGDFCTSGTLTANCTGQPVGNLCGDGLGACLDLTGAGTLACVELCLESHGEMLRVGHPDCADTNAICDPTALAGVGFCF